MSSTISVVQTATCQSNKQQQQDSLLSWRTSAYKPHPGTHRSYDHDKTDLPAKRPERKVSVMPLSCAVENISDQMNGNKGGQQPVQEVERSTRPQNVIEALPPSASEALQPAPGNLPTAIGALPTSTGALPSATWQIDYNGQHGLLAINMPAQSDKIIIKVPLQKQPAGCRNNGLLGVLNSRNSEASLLAILFGMVVGTLLVGSGTI